jgi:hypothetical protein
MKRLLLLLTLILSLHVSPLKAVDALPEYTLKAAYLYNFALLTDWPKEKTTGNFNLCFYGHSPLNSAFSALEGKQIGEQLIQIRYVIEQEEMEKCQILFIHRVESKVYAPLIDKLKHLPILVVTDEKNMNNAHIQIVQERERLVFTINTKRLNDSNLTLSSRLLNLAKRVEP